MESNKSTYKKIIHFFDKLEDHVRVKLSRYPIVYSFIGGVAIVLFWRGVWDTADKIPFLNGPVSIITSVIILLVTGLFVSFFVGDRIILSGLKRDKKLIEKTESEIKSETAMVQEVKDELEKINQRLEKIEINEEKFHNK